MNSQPIVFLDVDGVLNSARWFHNFIDRVPHADTRDIDPHAVELVRGLLKATRARIVVSSSWRARTLTKTRRRFAAMGFSKASIIGQTPRLLFDDGPLLIAKTRGQEIVAWREQHRHDGPFVILDDSDDMEPYMAHLVLTDYAVGLTEADVERAKEVLGQ